VHARAAAAVPGAALPGQPLRHLVAHRRPGVEECAGRRVPAHAAPAPRHGVVALRRDARPRRLASSRSRTCATSASRSPAAGGCSTSTPTRSRSTTRFAEDPLLAPLVARTPAAASRARSTRASSRSAPVLGQQVSTAAARTHAARLVVAHGDPSHRS
jgi:AraC family transcriptional regulator of adaptative response / DNA-3-methyladenine glycosylase II